MTFQINLSELGGNAVAFENAVKEHIARLQAFNMEIGKPRPVAHPVVEQAIKRVQTKGQPDQYEADYTIVDDTPIPHVPTLAEKKQALLNVVLKLENEAKFKMLPEAKMRLTVIKYQMAAAKMKPDPADLTKVIDERTAEDREIMDSYTRIQGVWRGFELIGAQAQSDIDDLTEDTIDSWQMPTFG